MTVTENGGAGSESLRDIFQQLRDVRKDLLDLAKAQIELAGELRLMAEKQKQTAVEKLDEPKPKNGRLTKTDMAIYIAALALISQWFPALALNVVKLINSLVGATQ